MSLLETIRRTLGLVDPSIRGLAVALIISAFLSSVLEAAGVGMIFVMFAVIEGGSGGAGLPAPARLIVGDTFGTANAILIACGILFGVLLFKTVASLTTAWIKSTLLMRVYASFAGRLMSGYLRRPLSYHLKVNSGDLIHTTINASYTVTHSCVGSLFDLIVDALTLLAIVALLLWTSPRTTMIAMAGTVVIGSIYWLLARDRISRWGTIVNTQLAEMQKVAVQAYQGVKTIKVFGRESSFVLRFDRYVEVYGRYARRNSIVTQVPRQGLELFVAAVLLGALAIVVLLGGAPGQIIPQLALLGAAAYRVMPALIRVTNSVQNLKFGGAALTQLHDALAEAGVPAATGGQAPAVHLSDAIEFRNVGFEYGTDRTDAALTDVSFIIRRGEIVAFTGESGAGKTTLVDILLGLLAPTSGELRFDGKLLSNFMALPRTLFGYVPQDTFLVDDTLSRNIALGLPDREIDEKRIHAAIEGAALGDFVAGLPEGLKTGMGDRGVRLSGGQRQRLGIARAMYHDPDILVFDEPTSALDPATESAIAKTIGELRGRKTVVLVTHRFMTARGADRVYHLNRGRIVDSGSIDEMTKRNTDIRDMADRQELAPAGIASV